MLTKMLCVILCFVFLAVTTVVVIYSVMILCSPISANRSSVGYLIGSQLHISAFVLFHVSEVKEGRSFVCCVNISLYWNDICGQLKPWK